MSSGGDRMSLDAARGGGQVERDIEQAITTLKKGACLLKYGRRGKPKFCPFRLSNDESILIWFSGREEKHLKLSHVSRIISGQRTPIFHRYPRPEKEYQSFSLIYSDRSLDIICKDKDEAEVWFSGLKALISRSRQRKWGTESRSEGISSEANSPRTYTRRSSPLHSPFGNSESLMKDGNGHHRFHSPYGSPRRNGHEKGFSDLISYALPPKGFLPSDPASGSLNSLSSGGGSDGLPCQVKTLGMDAFRVSLSSAVSSSSQGSAHDDGDALGDVFLWGEGTGGEGGPSIRSDCLVPKPLESAVVLDVQSIACGRLHAALVTKNGEVFSWGEESGGRLGHGVDSNVLQPKHVDALSATNIELVSCGEYHSCAVTLSGDLYTWGDGRSGILGHGNEVNQWVPKKVNGPLEGLHVSSIACGPWHTAVVTSAGQLFTFGEGTFGALGHGDCTSVSRPREIDSLKGLRTVRAACGAWHTAAVVEVMVGNSSSSNCSSGKIFTWGDGDKGSLGHVEDKEPKLVPTCVAALVDPNFCQVACGHSMTVALTTSGQVYTMGSPVYGQLGNPNSDTKLPRRVEGKLAKVFVEDIACGEYHVAVLTSRTEVYTWGKGANGRLGHGDTDDRSSPTLVESLKDKQVKSIACGTSFTAATCLHKWVSGVDQSMCSGCRLIFNFTRKRRNCYNCGLVFCNSCSSKKLIRASMAPNPNKPYRVCDNCYAKLKKIIETDVSSHSRSNIQRFNNVIDKDEKSDTRSRPYLSRLSSMESIKQTENRVSPIPIGNSKSSNPVFVQPKKFFSASVPGSRIASRATSPISSRLSPTRSITPTPTFGGLTTNDDLLSQEVNVLRAQVENLTARAKLKEAELERSTKQLKEAIAIAGEETAKSKAAKEVIKSLTAQVKEMAERMPIGSARNVNIPVLTSVRSNNDSGDISHVSNERSNGNAYSHSLPNGSSSAVNRNSGQYKQNQSENDENNGGARSRETDSLKDNEWVEQDEPGVYITLTSLPGGSKDLKRVRFSRKRFSEKQAEVWWAENRTRVYEHYNIRMADKSSIGIGSEDLTH